MSNLRRSPYESQWYVYIFKQKLLKFSQEYSEQLQRYRVGEISSSLLLIVLSKGRACQAQRGTGGSAKNLSVVEGYLFRWQEGYKTAKLEALGELERCC